MTLSEPVFTAEGARSVSAVYRFHGSGCTVPGIHVERGVSGRRAPFGVGCRYGTGAFPERDRRLPRVILFFVPVFPDVVRFCCNAGENQFYRKRMRGQRSSPACLFTQQVVFSLFQRKRFIGMAYHRSMIVNIRDEIRYFCKFHITALCSL